MPSREPSIGLLGLGALRMCIYVDSSMRAVSCTVIYRHLAPGLYYRGHHRDQSRVCVVHA